MNKISLEELSRFVGEANKATYANKDAPKIASTRLGSEDYRFENGNLVFHDTYFGGRDFMGNEVVYQDSMPVWGMVYYGYLLNAATDTKAAYSILRPALMQEYDDIIPVRGPKVFEQDGWRYVNSVDGPLDRFTGVEEIYHGTELVYRCNYQGGFIE